MTETIMKSPIPCYESVEDQRYAGTLKLTGEDPTYLRYGTPIHAEVEERVAELAGAEAADTLIFNSGMSALTATIKAGITLSGHEAGRETLKKIAIGHDMYTGTTRWTEAYARQYGIDLCKYDAGDSAEVAKVLEEFKPDVFVAETVGNYVNAPVLDHEHALEVNRALGQKSLLIFDRTLPLSTASDVYEATVPADRAVVVDSGTKAMTLNQETLGVVITKNPEILTATRAVRNDDGTLPGVGSARYIAELLPAKDDFNERNRRVFNKTGQLATYAYQASRVTNEGFIVGHPALPCHGNYQDVHVSDSGNITPVFFLLPLAFGKGSLDFAQKIGDDPAVREHIQLSDSFGFDQTAFYSAEAGPYVRIAPGAETDVDQLGPALYNALVKSSH